MSHNVDQASDAAVHVTNIAQCPSVYKTVTAYPERRCPRGVAFMIIHVRIGWPRGCEIGRSRADLKNQPSATM